MTQASASLDARAELSVFGTTMLAGLYIVVSTGLIAFNKYLMTGDRFPFAIPLVMIHMSFCFICCFALMCYAPYLFPSMKFDSAEAKSSKYTAYPKVVWGKFKESFRFLFPISLVFCGTLVLSNVAYLYCSLAFLQMMKEGNLLLVYAASLAIGLETVNRNISQKKLSSVLLFILFATCMTVYGEIKFVLVGFLIQLASQLCEVGKIVLQNQLLANKKKDEEVVKDEETAYGSTESKSEEKKKDTASSYKMDPLTFVLLISPFCFFWLMIKFAFVHTSTGEVSLILAKVYEYKHLLVLNCCVAFALNVTIAFFMKFSTALTFIIAGIVKDVFIVMMSWLGFQEHISGLQWFAFAFQTLGIFVYSLMKSYPHYFMCEERSVFSDLKEWYRGEYGAQNKEVTEFENADNSPQELETTKALLQRKVLGDAISKASESSISEKSTDGKSTDGRSSRATSESGFNTASYDSEEDANKERRDS